MASARTRRLLGSVSLAIGGAALLAWYVRRQGVGGFRDGLVAVGPWFTALLALSFARFAVRSLAWITLLRSGTSLGEAIAATIAGDAIGNITPLGLAASEPAKAVYLSRGLQSSPTRDRFTTSHALAALTAENFFYSISVALYVVIGTTGMLGAFVVPPDIWWTAAIVVGAMAMTLVAAAWLAWQRPTVASALLARLGIRRLDALVERVRAFEVQTYGSAGGHAGQLAAVAACETAFHLLSFAEAWLILRCLTGGQSLPLEALVLDTFSRVSNIAFKMVPLRLGIDQVGSGTVAHVLGLPDITGGTFSVVRLVRVLVWAVVGLGILVRNSTRARRA